MKVKEVNGNHILIEGDSGFDYDVDLRKGCPCRWGTYILSHPEKAVCKHYRLAKHLSLMRS